jgi:hypothetical protein
MGYGTRLAWPPATCMLTLLLLIQAPCRANTDAEGPPRPTTCDSLAGTTRAILPLARIAVLDLAMYAGLVILWPHAFSPDQGSREQFRESFSERPYMNYNKVFFELDDDPWVINGVLHGLYGSEVYLSGRTIGHSGLVSFLYAMFASVTWEYLVEGWFHQPSAIDLAWTPVAGAVIGELRFQLLRLIMRHVSSRMLRNILMTTIDPVGQLERAIIGCTIHCGY